MLLLSSILPCCDYIYGQWRRFMRTLRRSKSCRVRKVKGKLEVFRGRDPTMCFKCHADFGHQELPAVGGLHACALENLKIVLSRPSDIPAENVAISPRKVANAGVRALSIEQSTKSASFDRNYQCMRAPCPDTHVLRSNAG